MRRNNGQRTIHQTIIGFHCFYRPKGKGRDILISFWVTAFPFRPIETMKPNNRLVNCTLTIISPHSAFRSEGTLHIIGFGSRLYKKLSWNVKFNKKFLGRKSMKLRAMASDPALIREMLATSLYKSVGVPVQEGTFARLFINGDTYGLYYLTDSSSKKWISGYIHGNANSDIGISYKLYVSPPYYPDFHYYGDNYLNYTTYYFPDEYEDKDIDVSDESSVYTRVIEFIKLFDQWVNTPNQPLSQLKEFLNVEALIRMMVMDTLTLGLDNFMLRLSNASIYYNPERKNYLIIPYDFDSVLYGGRDDSMLNLQTVDKDCHTWAFQHEEIIDHYFARTILAHPEIRKRYDVVLAKTTKELFNGKVLSDYIDAVVDLIHEDVQWNFESLGRLAIPYNGFENHYTLENFEGNLNATAVIYKKGVIDNNTPYGLMQWINIRSQNCQEATEDAKTSKNENISDNYKMKVYKETTTDDISVISPAVLGSASSNASIILPSLKYIMFSVFILIKFLLL